MAVPMWKRCAGTLLDVLDLLNEHPHIVMDEHFEGGEDRTAEPEPDEDCRVWGNMVAFVERLDDELFKSLQACRHCCSRHYAVFCAHGSTWKHGRLL